MSGGHFDYIQYRLNDISDEIDRLIANNLNENEDEYGGRIGTFYNSETVEKFKKASHRLKQASEMLQRIDWLVCDDDGEETFLERWDEWQDKIK